MGEHLQSQAHEPPMQTCVGGRDGDVNATSSTNYQLGVVAP